MWFFIGFSIDDTISSLAATAAVEGKISPIPTPISNASHPPRLYHQLGNWCIFRHFGCRLFAI
jgi:hypothetical protein